MTRWFRGFVLALVAIAANFALPPPQAEALQSVRDIRQNDLYVMPAASADIDNGVQGQTFAFAAASAPIMPRASPVRSAADFARSLVRPLSPIAVADDTPSSRTADRPR